VVEGSSTAAVRANTFPRLARPSTNASVAAKSPAPYSTMSLLVLLTKASTSARSTAGTLKLSSVAST
jgi:hypothetical protein